jgi:hypothetical protein
VEIRTARVGRECRDDSVGNSGVCGKRGLERRREPRRVQRRSGDAVLSMAVAASRPINVGEVGAHARGHLVIEQLVETGKRESAPQHAEHDNGGTTPGYRVRHRVMILQDRVFGPVQPSRFNLAESLG